MSKLGGLYYDVTLKDSTGKGLSSIERRIKRMSATISPKISAPDLNRQIKDATSKLKVANIQVNVTANTANLGANIQTAVNAGTYVARIGADTNGLIANIQEAINKATFTAKVAKVDIKNGEKGLKATEQKVTIKADTSEIASSIQKAIGSQAYVAKINADTNGFISAIQTAIASNAFTAKVNLDKSSLAGNANNKKNAEAKTTNAAIKDTTYSVDVKARAAALRQSIKESIAQGEFKVVIEAKAQILRQSIKNAIANGVFKANIVANVQSLKKSITDALANASFKANVGISSQSFRKSIKDALSASEYKAKVAADTTMLASAIQGQINKQTFTAKVTLTGQSATTDKKKKSEEVTNTQTKKRKDEPIKITVDASSAPKTIQTAIDSKNYTAKVLANTEALVKAIDNAIPKERTIKISGAVSTSGASTKGSSSKGTTPQKISDSEIKKIQAQAAKIAQNDGVSQIKGDAIRFYTDRINEQTRGLNDLEAKLKRVKALIGRRGSANDLDKSLVARLEARKNLYESDIAHLANSRSKIESKNNWTEESLRAQMNKSAESYIAAQSKANAKAEAKAAKERDKALSDHKAEKVKNEITGQLVARRKQAQASKEESQALKDQARSLQEILALRNKVNKERAKANEEEAKQAHKNRENDIRAALAEKDRRDKAQAQALKAQTISLSDKLNERANNKAQAERLQKLEYYRSRIGEYERGVKELQSKIERMQSLSFKRGDSSQLTSEAIKRAQGRLELYRTKIEGLSNELNKISLGKWDGKTDHTNRQIGLEKALSNQVAAQEKANRDRDRLIEKYKAESARNHEKGLRNAQNIATRRNIPNTESTKKVAEASSARNSTSQKNTATNTQSLSRVLSEDEKSYVRELRQRLRSKADEIRRRIDGYGNLISVGKSLGNLAAGRDKRFTVSMPEAVEEARKQLAALENLYNRFYKMSEQKSLPIPKIQSLGGYGSVPSNHSEMQRKWEAHFAWKDELAAQEKSKRAEKERLVAIKAANEQRRQAAASARQYATEMQRVASEFQNVGNRGGWLRDQLQNIFSMYGAQQFLQNIIMIGGEFEKQRIALGALFQNVQKGNETFESVKKWSVKSPFTFSQLTSYTKQLASFGFQYRDVLDTTKKLADISAGVGVDMGRVILAYGQVFTAKYLRGPELRQFTEAGIPMVDELSRVLTERMQRKVTPGEVYKLISSREVKFEDVEKVINNITGEGGAFYKMQEKQSESLVGKWTNLKDAIEIMYSDIGSASDGWLKGSISLLTKLALNWKGVGISILAVAGAYGLLSMKNRLVFSTAARETSLIASIKAKKAAIDSQIESYNQLAEAIAKKNYVEGKDVGSKVGYLRQTNRYTWRERFAAKNMATRLAYNGVTNITPLYAGATQPKLDANGKIVGFTGNIDKEFQRTVNKAKGLYRRLQRLKMDATGSIFDKKTWQLWGTQSQIAMNKVGLSLKAIGASIASTAASMLPMLAITAAIGGIMYWKQNKAEQENRTKEMVEGAKSSYKEVSDYLRDNPIEVVINKKDPNELKDIIENYREQARNSPINIDFAISNSENMYDAESQLRYLRRQIEYVAKAEKYASENGAGIASGIKDKTGGWFNDDYAENVKDYSEALDELNKASSKIEERDLNKLIRDLDIKSTTPTFGKDIRDDAASLSKELKKLMSEGASTNRILDEIFYSDYHKTHTMTEHDAIKDGLDAYGGFKSAQNTLDSDSQKAAKTIREKLEAIPDALDAKGRMTDFGHTIMVRLAQSIGEDAGLVKEQIDLIVGDFEGRFRPSMNATWQQSSQAMNALMNQLRTNCADLFQGMDLSNGFTEEQRKAIQACIDNAPAECNKYTAVWQRLLDSRQLYLRIGAEFNATSLQGVLPGILQSIWNANFKNSKKHGQYAPGKDDDIVSWGEVRKASLERSEKELKHLNKSTKTSQSQARINELTENIKNEKEAFKRIDPVGYYEYEEKANKKDNQAAAKAQRAKEKAQRDKEEQQRKEEARLQKRFQQIKRVREMYEKLRELYGDEGAMKKIKQSGLIPTDLIPDNVKNMEDFLKKYRAIMKKFYNSYKANSENLRNLNSQVAQDLLNIQFDQEKEALDKAVKTLETQLERAGDAWTRYKNLVSDGLDKPLANFLAFGVDFHSDSYQSDDSGSLRLDYLRKQAATHIATKAPGKSTSDYDMDRYLGMNEEELKTEFGNNEQVTKGLWTIVKAYQDAAKNITSENDKLITELYKNSMSYAKQIESIAHKHKGERATIKEMQEGYAPAKKEYDSAVAEGKRINKAYNIQYTVASSTPEFKAYNEALADLDDWRNKVANSSESDADYKTNKKGLEDATKVFVEKLKAYENTTAYKNLKPFDVQMAKNEERQKIAKQNLSKTLPPNVAEVLLRQSKINERNEKSEVSKNIIEGSDGYIELFNNIYNLASKTANEIADELVNTLDEKLAKGEINQETYTSMRNEISQKRNEVYEKGADSKNAKAWQVGIGGVTKNKIQQAQAEQETAGKEMDSIQKQIDQNNTSLTSEEKAQKIADIKQQLANENQKFNEADKNKDEAGRQQASNRIGELNRALIDTQNTATVTPEERTAKGILLSSKYDEARKRYEEADAQGNQLAKKQAKQDMIQSGFGMAANIGQNLTQFRDTLGNTLDSFGMDTENNEGFQKFSTAVDVMSDVSSGMSNAMQSMMSGDFVGAAFSIIETPMNVANAFAKLHDKKLDIQINQSKELQEEVQTAADELKTAIQDSLGSEDAKKRAMSRQGEMAQILADAGVEDTIGAGLVYSLLSGKESGSDVISENKHKFYGKDGKVTDNEYRHVFNFGKFLGNTLALGTSSAIGAIPGTGYTTYLAGKNSMDLKRNEEAKAYTRMADALEKAQFGKHDQVSIYGAQYAALLEQRKQLEYQMKLEQDKSNTDEDKVKDARKQIQELNTRIHEYITNLAKELYGIDFSSWANKLGDALTNAFRNGEDAAAAFHDTVGDIMADLVKNMIIADAIKPMFSKLEETLFGKDGAGNGMIDMNDMEGSIQKAVPYISDFFNQVENSVPGWEKLYDVLDEASGGILKKTSSSSSSLSGSIKGITEETSTLLASYINAIRLDVSVNRKNLDDLAKVTIPKMSVIAENQLKQLNVIADRATQIEENTRKNSESVEMIRTFLGSVSITTSGGKAIRFKG